MTRQQKQQRDAPEQVLVDGRPVTLREDALLGVGGEGRVYRIELADGTSRALKVFHPLGSAPDRALAAEARRRRIAKLQAFPRDLPRAVLAPERLARGGGGDVVGYAMPLFEGGVELSRLGQRRWREGVVSNEGVFELFRHLFIALDALHGRGIAVGDLNDGNGLFRPRERVVGLIDADSMQLPGHPCTVFHERFLDPLLFDATLVDGDAYSAESDWYAFAVLLFASLLYVHPYGGVHPALPNLRRRAEAAISVLSDDVTRPRVALDPRILGADLYGYFEDVFERERRGRFPARLLELRWRRCDGCGVEHLGAPCLLCRESVAVAAAPPQRSPEPLAQVLDHGRCCATVRLATTGQIVEACLSEGRLCWLVADGETVRREDGKRALEQRPEPGMRFAIAGASTWIGYGGRVVRVEGEAPREQLQTERGLFGEPLFDASALLGCVVVTDGLLKAAPLGRRWGSVLAPQCWLRVGEHLGAGFYRAGRALVFFAFEGARGGLSTALLPSVDGRVVDASCAFGGTGDDRALLGVASEHQGRRAHALFLLDVRGRLLGSRRGHPDEDPLLASIAGKTLAGGRVFSSSDEGLLAVEVNGGRLEVARRFVDTEPFMDSATELIPGPGGTIYAHNPRELLQLALLR